MSIALFIFMPHYKITLTIKNINNSTNKSWIAKETKMAMCMLIGIKSTSATRTRMARRGNSGKISPLANI